MEHNVWKVESTPDKKTLKTVVAEIDSALKGNEGIKLDPEYQREYKFSAKDESLLIESLLMGIPIPVIYLSSDINKIPHVANVIDGQHRLRAVYRFLKNQFALKELEKYPELNDKRFSDLSPDLQNKLLYQCSLSFENIHVQNNPELEMEIFKRYNMGTHPLSKQEIRHAVYRSKFNIWLNQQIDQYFKDPYLKEIYNITKKRYSDKSAHESIYIMLSILRDGLNKNFETSPQYADHFMEQAAEYQDQDGLIDYFSNILDKVNQFLIKVYEFYKIRYPFSKEIYGVENRSYKLQTPILMLISAFLGSLLKKEIDLLNENVFHEIVKAIRETLKSSYLEENYKGSNTRPDLLEETLEQMITFYEKDKI
ncbi:DUF262 domain-containing protein [Anoxybacillus rupiensis]|uniref:DUF262 domain-containing protein n=1 Tax=Anoxybacteroides rupiense TaxID=311460 RepID=UPI001BA873D1|nr:DUF262 domain-containing protein [Anoxybacillus rupiensis]MBS2773021.1 DUF262 domain-containing protein [Anoxybacillus rupiensis]